MKGTWRVVSGLLVFWLLVLIYMSTTLYQSNDVSERTERQLAKAVQELDALKKQNEELQRLANELKELRFIADMADKDESAKVKLLSNRLKECRHQMNNLTSRLEKAEASAHAGPGIQSAVHKGPSSGTAPVDLDHEQIRRKVENGMTEFWFYLSSELNDLKSEHKDQADLVQKLNNVLETSVDHQRVLLTDVHNLSLTLGAEDWRQKEAEELSEIVQRRLVYLQNPKDCSKAKKIVCNLNKGCGYGCQLHHLLYCFIIAYGTERTLILESKGWRYSPSGWEKFFLPVSDTCTDRSGSSSRAWGGEAKIKDIQVVELPISDSMHPRPAFMPLAIPEDLAPRLVRLHGHPFVWWIGQFLKYLLRPQPELADAIIKMKEKLNFKTPVVGIHVRRTDKIGTEAAFHAIDEYMYHVNEYFDLLEKRQRVEKRRIFLATDDPNLLSETQQQYPEYEIYTEQSFSKSAGLGSRYSTDSLLGVVLDIHFLSRCSFLVCTFSSQVCRVAYEIMQALHPDASTYFRSLDDIYYYGGQNAHNQDALYTHVAALKDEIDLRPGDAIGVAGNHWNGYSKGTNRRTGKTGMYPSYKVADHIDIVKFPTYPEADKAR